MKIALNTVQELRQALHPLALNNPFEIRLDDERFTGEAEIVTNEDGTVVLALASPDEGEAEEVTTERQPGEFPPAIGNAAAEGDDA